MAGQTDVAGQGAGEAGPSGRTVSVVVGAESGLPRREARALIEFASRDPRVWRNIVVTWLVVVAALAVALVIAAPTNSPAQQEMSSWGAATVAVLAAPTVWVNWYLSTLRKVGRAVARQSPPGTVIGSRITADTVTFAVGEAAYSFTYEAISHVMQVDDVLVVKPRNHVVLAVPVEAVDPADLAHLRRRVVNEPLSRATTS